MKDLSELNEFQKNVLLVFCDATNFSLHSHVPIEAITKRFKKDISSKKVKKTIYFLVRNGFITEHPSGSMTYEPTRKGLDSGRIVQKELDL